ncbi:DUF1919 domain-containing protein [Selenomonas sp. KH1T6]|uniref:DUF1919 domain-containing protein n=1 Tax=Selenomonas sp. KH1T6 TaxID=3158784 RepID=UPI0008A751DA|nr:Uncharacterized protein, DUF1919 family [Selenomonas ruminantium]
MADVVGRDLQEAGIEPDLKFSLKIIIWGGGSQLSLAVNLLHELERQHDIKVLGITGNSPYYTSILGLEYIPKAEVRWDQVDAVLIVAGEKGTQSIRQELLEGEQTCALCLRHAVVNFEKLLIPGFTFHRQLELSRRHISIIANNCWGGVTYHYFKEQFYSPFINMFVADDREYLRMCRNLQQYLHEPLVLSGRGYNTVHGHEYPIFKLGDVQLDMNHYQDQYEAEGAWERRKERIDWHDLFIMMYTEKSETARAFDELPFKRKVCFTSFPTDVPSSMFVSFIKAPSMRGRKFWEAIIGMASGKYVFYDSWELLLHGDLQSRLGVFD